MALESARAIEETASVAPSYETPGQPYKEVGLICKNLTAPPENSARGGQWIEFVPRRWHSWAFFQNTRERRNLTVALSGFCK
jgi:hypothetical protein